MPPKIGWCKFRWSLYMRLEFWHSQMERFLGTNTGYGACRGFNYFSYTMSNQFSWAALTDRPPSPAWTQLKQLSVRSLLLTGYIFFLLITFYVFSLQLLISSPLFAVQTRIHSAWPAPRCGPRSLSQQVVEGKFYSKTPRIQPPWVAYLAKRSLRMKPAGANSRLAWQMSWTIEIYRGKFTFIESYDVVLKSLFVARPVHSWGIQTMRIDHHVNWNWLKANNK